MSYNGKKPWHRLPSESDRAYSAFCLFLNMGSKRSLYQLATASDSPPLSKDELALWSTTFGWTERVEQCEQFIQNELLNSDTYLSDSNIRQRTSGMSTSTTQAAKRLLASNFPVKRKVRYNAH
jgi:hypothetical protein